MEEGARAGYGVLGSLEVRLGDERVMLGPPKQRALLAVLLLHAGELVPADRLVELLWGERSPRTAAHSLQVYVSELRKVLEPAGAAQVIVTRPPGYMLEVDPDAIDARRFVWLVGEAGREIEAGSPSTAANRVREALALWRGPPLSDFAYDEFAQDEIRRLEQRRVDALELLATAELALGRAEAALGPIEAAIGEDPLRERARELQLLALYRVGRHPEALRAYERFRDLLSEELGLAPGPALQRLQERILLHDATLLLAPGPGPAPVPEPLRNPYKGLRPFGEQDAGDFFGREALVTELVGTLAAGTRLVALVGPSGSGKSSVIHAGLLPALRAGAVEGSQAWVVATMMPGQHPFEELGSALARSVPAAPGRVGPLDADDAALLSAARRILPDGRRLLLVIDQFEELFSFGTDTARNRFLRNLTTAVADPDNRVTVALALRADFYDRPLAQSGFAAPFSRGVVNVVPMTADGLESAVVMPARSVGVEVDPALLAQLVADTTNQPGPLPLLQYVLTELFDQRRDGVLALEAYQALGGLAGALSRRAEGLFARLAEDRRDVVLQVFLRLVRLSEGARHTRRRVSLHELAALDLDPVALSEVLDAFGRHRLLSFDRNPVDGGATVELAHEALLGEWKRLAGWIDRHVTDLRQHASLAAAAEEWESSGRDPDYLLIGTRLAEYEAWNRATALRLTSGERAFIAAGIARRRAEEAEAAARGERQRRLERRARRRLAAVLAATAVVAAVATFGALRWLGSRTPDVALLFEGTGGTRFGDMAASGFEDAVSEFGLDAETRLVSIGTREVEDELRRLSEDGAGLVVVGLGYDGSDATAAVAAEHPETRYVVWESEGNLPNVTYLSFRSEEAAFLAGAAAALTTRTGIIGFVGAWQVPIIDGYRAGYEAGARQVTPGIEVRSAYVADWPDQESADSPELAAAAAAGLYAGGADVILGALPSWGVFQAAATTTTSHGRKLWAIGVDADQYQAVLASVGAVPEGVDPLAWQPHILTSVTKRLDVAFYTVLRDYARGSLAPGARSLGLAEDGVGLADSGGFIDAIRPRLDPLKQAIIHRAIVVPTDPATLP